jgi:hypothetical protein
MPDVATCRHCSRTIERQPGEFWKHRHTGRERCLPGTRNAQAATPDGSWRQST